MNRWTKDEVKILKDNYGKIDINKLSIILSRSNDAIHWKASQLNISFKKNDVVELYAEISSINERINSLTNDIQNILSMISTMPKYNLNWTKEDREYIFLNYQKKSIKQIAKDLGRTPTSILGVISRFDLVKEKIPKITEDQENFIVENFNKMTYYEIKKELGITEYTLQKCLKIKNLSKNKERINK